MTAIAARQGIFNDQWRGRPYLLSPALDFLMCGGGALLALFAMMLLIPYEKHTEADVMGAAYVTAMVGWLSYAVNYPHFLSSYQLFYRNLPTRMQEMRPHKTLWLRTLNSAFIVPLLLLAMMVYAGAASAGGNRQWINYSLQLMFFTVGWHYTKQAFGVFIMLSALKNIFYTGAQRRILVVNAYTVWIASWVYLSYTSQFLGVGFQKGFISVAGGRFEYDIIEMPDIIRIPLLLVATLTTLATAWVIFSQWRATGVRPSITALAGYFTMYFLWAAVSMVHPEWAIVAPFFHSLQYMMFVIAFKRGELHARLEAAGLETMEEKAAAKKAKRLRGKSQEFFGFSFILGTIAFVVMPAIFFALYNSSNPGLIPLSTFVILFAVFINVHHFFIDNVIWRRENKDVSQYLIGWRKAKKVAA